MATAGHILFFVWDVVYSRQMFLISISIKVRITKLVSAWNRNERKYDCTKVSVHLFLNFMSLHFLYFIHTKLLKPVFSLFFFIICEFWCQGKNFFICLPCLYIIIWFPRLDKIWQIVVDITKCDWMVGSIFSILVSVIMRKINAFVAPPREAWINYRSWVRLHSYLHPMFREVATLW